MYVTKETAAEQTAVEQTIECKVRDYRTRVEQKRIPKPKHCQVCGHIGSLSWHGRYVRQLLTMAQIYTLPIKRLFCASCRHTFACLPDFLAKFYHYAKETIQLAVRMLQSHNYETVAGRFIATAHRCLAIVTLYLWRRQFV